MQRLARKLVATTDTFILDAPPDRALNVFALWVCNGHTSATNYYLHIVDRRNNEAVGASNALYFQASLAARTTNVVTGSNPVMVLAPGESLVGKASVASVLTFTVFGE